MLEEYGAVIAMEAFLGLPSKNRHRLSGWRLAAGNFLPSSDVLYLVSFKTPETEMQVLGPRAILVKASTGKCYFTVRE